MARSLEIVFGPTILTGCRVARLSGAANSPCPTANNGKPIGPELGFGYVMGHVLGEPVLILRSCIGDRSPDGDLLPRGSERYIVDGRTYERRKG